MLAMRDAAIRFNTETFGNIFKWKRHLMVHLNGIKAALAKYHFDYLVNLERGLVSQYNQVLKQDEILWFQKARMNKLKFGDRSTCYCHVTIVVKRKRNKIEALKLANGSWSSDPQNLKEEVLRFIMSFFVT